MGKALIHIQMALNIKVNGEMINNLEKVFKNGQMVQDTKVNIRMEQKMAKEFLGFLMEAIIKEIF